MIVASSLFPRVVSRKQAAATLLVVYLLLICLLLSAYVPWHSVNFILGVIGLPLTVIYGRVAPTSNRFLYLAVVLVGATFFIAEQAVLFIACSAIMFALWEAVWGKAPFIMLLTVLLMSPTAQFLIGVFSFPIRLQLTKLAGYALASVGQAVTIHGNVITRNGFDFSVDPACVGLKMLLTSLLFGIFIIALLQHRHQKYLGIGSVFISLTLVALLNILANIIRIITLVQFSILPKNLLHEVIGLACLIVYVLLPSVLIINLLVRLNGTSVYPVTKEVIAPRQSKNLSFILSVIAIPVIIVSAWWSGNKQVVLPAAATPYVAGYNGSWYEPDILQYKNDASLVYIKKLKGGLYGEHNPLMCWLGAGYQFKSVEQATVMGKQVYVGLLTRDQEQLYTAWWYDNGKTTTISQMEWRWQAVVNGESYAVVNVTASSRKALETELAVIISQKQFASALR